MRIPCKACVVGAAVALALGVLAMALLRGPRPEDLLIDEGAEGQWRRLLQARKRYLLGFSQIDDDARASIEDALYIEVRALRGQDAGHNGDRRTYIVALPGKVHTGPGCIECLWFDAATRTFLGAATIDVSWGYDISSVHFRTLFLESVLEIELRGTGNTVIDFAMTSAGPLLVRAVRFHDSAFVLDWGHAGVPDRNLREPPGGCITATVRLASEEGNGNEEVVGPPYSDDIRRRGATLLRENLAAFADGSFARRLALALASMDRGVWLDDAGLASEGEYFNDPGEKLAVLFYAGTLVCGRIAPEALAAWLADTGVPPCAAAGTLLGSFRVTPGGPSEHDWRKYVSEVERHLTAASLPCADAAAEQ